MSNQVQVSEEKLKAMMRVVAAAETFIALEDQDHDMAHLEAVYGELVDAVANYKSAVFFSVDGE